MKRLCLTILAILSFAGTFASAAAALPPGIVTLTPDQEAADVGLLRGAYEHVHPGLYRYTPKGQMDDAFDELGRFATTPHTSLELYGAISRTLATIHCDHTKAEYPAAFERYRTDRPTFFPFRFRLFDGRMYVASSDPDQVRLPRGAEILSINGVAVETILASLQPYISYDGFTSFVRGSKIEADADLMGSDFEQFYPVLYGIPAHVALTIREPGDAASRAVGLAPITFAQWTALAWPALAFQSQVYNGTSWRMLTKATAYLRADSFVNYRHPVDPTLFYASFFTAINASEAQNLVVDLRWNGGGSTDATIALARFLMDRTFTWNAPLEIKTLDYGDLPAYAQTWGDSYALFHPDPRAYTRSADGFYAMIPGKAKDEDGEMQPITAAPQRFRGRIIVLTGDRNASGSTMLIAKLRDAGRITTVGTATGGSAEGPTAGYLLFLKLPQSGITVRVPDRWNRMSVTHFTYGYGVAADAEVPETLADFRTGTDAALAHALEIVQHDAMLK